MTPERFLELLVVSFFPTLISAVALLWQIRRERNKPGVDQSETAKNQSEADKNQVEIDRIRNEITQDILDRTQEERNQMKSEIVELRQSFKIVMSFARTEWRKSKANYEYMEKIGVADKAPGVPASDFPTGPLIGVAQ